METQLSDDGSKEEGEISDDLDEEDVIFIGVENVDPLSEKQTKVAVATPEQIPTLPNHTFWSKLRSSNTPKHQREFRKDNKAVPCLLDLNLTPVPSFFDLTKAPPPPPSVPPPLPSGPPPVPPPPPPLHLPPGEYKPQPKPTPANISQENAELLRAGSPLGDVEDSEYIDLLLEYKEIQQKLKALDDADSTETETKASDLPDESPKEPKVNTTNKEVSKDVMESAKDPEDEEELALLQLRCDALRSAAVNQPTTEKKKTTPKKSHRKTTRHKSPEKKKKIENVRKRRAEVVPKPAASVAKRRRTVSTERELRVRELHIKEEEERLNRMKDRIMRHQEMMRRDEERKSERRLRDLQRILTLDDPKEQVRRFQELMGPSHTQRGSRQERERSPLGSKSPSKESRLPGSTGEDNYDTVEMDIDSQASNSPVIYQQDLDEGIEAVPDVHVIQPLSNESAGLYHESMKFWSTDPGHGTMHPGSMPGSFSYLPTQLHPPPPPPLHLPYPPEDQNPYPYQDQSYIPGLDIGRSYDDLVQVPSYERTDYSALFSSSAGNNTVIPGLDLVEIVPSSATPPHPAIIPHSPVIAESDMSLSPEPPQMEPFLSDSEMLPPGVEDNDDQDQDDKVKEPPKDEPEEDEADLLRAILLKSIAAKRKDSVDTTKDNDKSVEKPVAMKSADPEKSGATTNLKRETSNQDSNSKTSKRKKESSLHTSVSSTQLKPSLSTNLKRSSSTSEFSKKEALNRLKLAVSTSRSSSPHQQPSKSEFGLSKLEIPQHERVVVSLGADSSSEDDTAASVNKASATEAEDGGSQVAESLESSIDHFLKAARASVEIKASIKTIEENMTTSTTPEALQHLGPLRLREYRELKEELKKRQDAARVQSNTPTPPPPPSSSTSEQQQEGGGSSRTPPPPPTVSSRNITVGGVGSMGGIIVEVKRTGESSGVSSGTEGTAAEDTRNVITKETDKQQVNYMENKLKELKRIQMHYERQQRDLHDLLIKRKMRLKAAEGTVSKLREQIAMADRIANTASLEVANVNRSCMAVKEHLSQKATQISILSKQLGLLGKRVYGNSYRPGKQHRSEVNEAKDNSSKPTRVVKKVPSSIQITAPKSRDKILQEKQRLQDLEEQYRNMIKQYKEAQASVSDHRSSSAKSQRSSGAKSSSSTPGSSGANVVSSSSASFPLEKIITQETMAVGSGGEEIELIDMIRKKKRRTSSLGKTTGTKPVLVQKEKTKENIDSELNDDNTGNEEGFKFKMPSGAQLKNIAKLHRESLNKLPSVPQCCSLPVDGAAHLFPAIRKQPPSTARQTTITARAAAATSEAAEVPFGNNLHRFRSYRLSPYFRTKEGFKIPSATFSHKIQPRRVFCKYGLTGKCNDDKCPGQHESDFLMSDTDILQDLVSYVPSLAGVKPDTPLDRYPILIGDYVSEFQKQNSKMPHSQQCVLLASLVNAEGKKSATNTLVTEARKWRPQQSRKIHNVPVYDATDSDTKKTSSLSQEVPKKPTPLEADDIVSDHDLRYWMGSSLDTQDMESALEENPQDVNLWIKVAYKKLHGSTGNASDHLDEAVEVLARGLEANRSSSELWRHYLSLYGRRPESEDVAAVCRQALHYAPSYHLHWKNMQLSESYPDKESASRAAWEFVSQQNGVKLSVRSHQVLEAVLYHVTTATLSGRLKTAINVFQSLMRPKGGLLRSWTSRDRVLAHLCFIHLAEFHRLPVCLFDPAISGPGKIVSKDVFVLPWTEGGGSRLPEAKLQGLLDKALKACSGADIKTQWPIYLNVIQLHMAHNRIESAIEVCRSLTGHKEIAEDVWLKLAQLQPDMQQKIKVLSESVAAQSNSLCLANSLAVLYMQTKSVPQAETVLTEVVKGMFQLTEDTDTPSTILMYRQLLKQSLPLRYTRLLLKAGMKITPTHRLYLWLNYCLLLELQEKRTAAEEAYETALSKLRQQKHLQLLWIRFLHFVNRAPKCNANSLYQRCLNTMPVKTALINSTDNYWLDYSFHNQVVNMYIESLSREDQTDAYLSLVTKMPTNATLIQRCFEHLLLHEDIVRARGITVMALQDLPHCLPLWKIELSLIGRDPENKYQLRRSYQRAVANIPFALSLWKNMLLWEVSQGSEASVRAVLDKCRPLVNMADFARTILLPSKQL